MKAAVQVNQGKLDDAVASAQRAVALVESGADERSRRATEEGLVTLLSAMNVARHPGRLAVARRGYELAQAIYPARSTNVLQSRAMYAHALVSEGDADVGLRELKTVLVLQVAALGPDHRDVEFTREMIAAAAIRRGDLPTALESSLEALRTAERRSAGAPAVLATVMRVKYGLALALAFRNAEAEQQLRGAVEEFAAMQNASPVLVRRALAEHALVLARMERLAEADREFERALALPASNPSEAASIGGQLGTLRSLQGRHQEALTLLREQHETSSKQGNAMGVASALAAIGAAQLRAGDPAKALETLQQATAQFEMLHPRVSPMRADLLLHTAQAHFALGRLACSASRERGRGAVLASVRRDEPTGRAGGRLARAHPRGAGRARAGCGALAARAPGARRQRVEGGPRARGGLVARAGKGAEVMRSCRRRRVSGA